MLNVEYKAAWTTTYMMIEEEGKKPLQEGETCRISSLLSD